MPLRLRVLNSSVNGILTKLFGPLIPFQQIFASTLLLKLIYHLFQINHHSPRYHQTLDLGLKRIGVILAHSGLGLKALDQDLLLMCRQQGIQDTSFNLKRPFLYGSKIYKQSECSSMQKKLSKSFQQIKSYTAQWDLG